MSTPDKPPGIAVTAPPHFARRALLGGSGLLAALAACGWPMTAAAEAGDDAAFEAKTARDALRALGDVVLDDPRLTLTLPDVVDNGAVVPVSVEWRLPRVTEIYVVVDGNPNPVAVQFVVGPGMDPFLSLRLKMAASGTVFAVARAGHRAFATSRSAQVAVGGCG